MNRCNSKLPTAGLTHELIPYRWTYKYSGQHLTSKKIESLFCQKCFEVIHMADIHEYNATNPSQIDTSE